MSAPTRIVLAPMEGLVDAVMRRVLTGIGGYDWCVTEFVRVASTPLSPRRLLSLCPELSDGARTAAGTPVRVQLLGADPALLADSAALAAALGPPFGIDLNFGCPAPTVNRRRGGAALLNEPELLHAIAVAVRAALPEGLVLSAKMRLGIDDPGRAVECAQALAAGGVGELVVHARTRTDGYHRPARWEWIARIRERLAVPVIANGDVWTVADWAACRAVTGCDAVMLGRGVIGDPFLARRLRGEYCGDAWADLLPAVIDFWLGIQAALEPRQCPGRLKQWLGQLGRKHPPAVSLFAALRQFRQAPPITMALRRHAAEYGLGAHLDALLPAAA